MDNRHLWLRSRKQVAVMQIRNAIIYATQAHNGRKIQPASS